MGGSNWTHECKSCHKGKQCGGLRRKWGQERVIILRQEKKQHIQILREQSSNKGKCDLAGERCWSQILEQVKGIFMQGCRVLLRNTTLFPKTLSPKITGGKSEVNAGTPTSHNHGNCHQYQGIFHTSQTRISLKMLNITFQAFQ